MANLTSKLDALEMVGVLDREYEEFDAERIIVVKDSKGELSTASKSEILAYLKAGGTVERAFINDAGHLGFAYPQTLFPKYCIENYKITFLNHGAAYAVAYGTGVMDGKLLMIDCAGQMFMSTIYEYNYIAKTNKSRIIVSGVKYLPRSHWAREIEPTTLINDKVLKQMWSFSSNNSKINIGKDKRKTLYLLYNVTGIDDVTGARVVVGHVVLTRNLQIKCIPNSELRKALFINAHVQDEYNKKTAVCRVDTCELRAGSVDTNITYSSINIDRENFDDVEECESIGLGTDLNGMYRMFNYMYFNGELPGCVQIEWNSRLTRVAGWCSNFDRVINISTEYAKRFPDDVGSVLLHEMIHLRERNHTAGFKAEMDRIQMLGGDVNMHSKGRAKIPKYTVKCTECGNEFQRDRLVAGNALCAKCRGTEFVYRLNGDYTSDYAGMFLSREMIKNLG